MRIELDPIDGSEGTWWEVPQECNGMTEEYESCSCIQGYDGNISRCKGRPKEDIRITGVAINKNECEEETDRDCDDWKDGDSERGDTPENLLGVRGERKVPSCTMNATENGAKNQQEEEVPVQVILVKWSIERRNVCGVNWEGS